MKQLILVFFTFFLAGSSFGQEASIPGQYRPLEEVYGDLNKDGVDEKVVVYNMTDVEDDVNGTDREIVIFRKEGQGWIAWHRSTRAIGNSKDGGMMGDPFAGVEIKNGLLLIYQSGGSSWKWTYTDKYRFQNNRFELIGHTHHYGRVCDYWTSFDYNITTGKIVYTKEYETCEGETNVVSKKEQETFSHPLKKRVTLANRLDAEVKIVTPKYKDELYL